MSGFTGTRRIRSWQERVRALAALQLIEIKAVGGRKIGAILMLDPRQALEALRRDGKIRDDLWRLVQKRYLEVGNLDIGDPLAESAVAEVVPINRPKSKRLAKSKG